jgi:hypothetical protein
MTYLGQKRIAQMESSFVTSTARYTIETPVSEKNFSSFDCLRGYVSTMSPPARSE